MLRCDGDFLCFVVFLVFGICWGFVFFCFFSWEVNLCLLVFVFAWVGLRLYLRYLLFSVGGLLVFFDVLSLFKSSTRVPVFSSFLVFRHSHFLHPFNLGSLFLGYNI